MKKNIKKDFPIFKKNPNLVYLDSAATSQKPRIVLDAINEYYTMFNANIKRGLYPISEKATEKVEKVRKKVAKFINAKHSEEIIFVRNATEGVNLVAYAWGRKNIQKNDVVTTTIMEHHSNFIPWQQLARGKGAKFEVLDINNRGELRVSPPAGPLRSEASEAGNYESRITNAKLLALTHVSNMLGTINPIRDITKKLRTTTYNPPTILVDAAQSAAHMKIDVQNLNCDFLVFSGHKMFASTGIGVLYGKKELLRGMSPFLFGGEMVKTVGIEETTFADIPEKFEAGTPDIAGIISLGAAIDYIVDVGFATIQKHEKELMAYSLSHMEKISGLTIYGPESLNERSGVISFNMAGIHPHDVAQILGGENICIRAGHHCAMPIHAFLNIPASARVSFSLYNDEGDIDKFIKGLKKVKKIFKV